MTHANPPRVLAVSLRRSAGPVAGADDDARARGQRQGQGAEANQRTTAASQAVASRETFGRTPRAEGHGDTGTGQYGGAGVSKSINDGRTDRNRYPHAGGYPYRFTGRDGHTKPFAHRLDRRPLRAGDLRPINLRLKGTTP